MYPDFQNQFLHSTNVKFIPQIIISINSFFMQGHMSYHHFNHRLKIRLLISKTLYHSADF